MEQELIIKHLVEASKKKDFSKEQKQALKLAIKKLKYKPSKETNIEVVKILIEILGLSFMIYKS
jgi:hypothetical protein